MKRELRQKNFFPDWQSGGQRFYRKFYFLLSEHILLVFNESFNVLFCSHFTNWEDS